MSERLCVCDVCYISRRINLAAKKNASGRMLLCVSSFRIGLRPGQKQKRNNFDRLLYLRCSTSLQFLDVVDAVAIVVIFVRSFVVVVIVVAFVRLWLALTSTLKAAQTLTHTRTQTLASHMRIRIQSYEKGRERNKLSIRNQLAIGLKIRALWCRNLTVFGVCVYVCVHHYCVRVCAFDIYESARV